MYVIFDYVCVVCAIICMSVYLHDATVMVSSQYVTIPSSCAMFLCTLCLYSFTTSCTLTKMGMFCANCLENSWVWFSAVSIITGSGQLR